MTWDITVVDDEMISPKCRSRRTRRATSVAGREGDGLLGAGRYGTMRMVCCSTRGAGLLVGERVGALPHA